MPERGKRKRKVKHPGLTDLNAGKKTVKARLSKKIFNKYVLQFIKYIFVIITLYIFFDLIISLK